MQLKGLSNLKLWWPFCSAELNHLLNFGRGYQEEQFCDNILNLGQCFRSKCLLKNFLSGAVVTLPVQWSRTIYANLKISIMAEYSCGVRTSGSGDGRTDNRRLR